MAAVSLENWEERIRDPKVECMSSEPIIHSDFLQFRSRMWYVCRELPVLPEN